MLYYINGKNVMDVGSSVLLVRRIKLYDQSRVPFVGRNICVIDQVLLEGGCSG